MIHIGKVSICLCSKKGKRFVNDFKGKEVELKNGDYFEFCKKCFKINNFVKKVSNNLHNMTLEEEKKLMIKNYWKGIGIIFIPFFSMFLITYLVVLYTKYKL